MRRALVTTVIGALFLVLAPAASAHPTPVPTAEDPTPLISQGQEARKDRAKVRIRKCLPAVNYARPFHEIAPGWRHYRVHRHRAKLARDLERPTACNPVAPPATKELAKRMAAQRGWTGYQWDALDVLWQRESQWHACRHYPSTTNCNYSGNAACGLPQFVPCSKLLTGCGPTLGTCPSSEQIRRGLNYIAGRYGSPSSALAHSNAYNWY